jgi:exonuclease SbcD
VVIIGGNHDSPTFLNAPAELLRALDVHVVGCAAADPADEVIVLRDRSGAPEMIVAAVPYLRDRDLRTAEAGESLADKEGKLRRGIAAHYAAVGAAARNLRANLGNSVPLVVTGHLFAAGGSVSDDDGLHELYIGTALSVGDGVFPPEADYVALGHLHTPQVVGGRKHVRYSGAPIPMGFGEAGLCRGVCLVTFGDAAPEVSFLEAPVFRRLLSVHGDVAGILEALGALAGAAVSDGSLETWVEVVHEGDAPGGDLRERVQETVADAPLVVLRVRDPWLAARALSAGACGRSLDELDEHEVFLRLLDAARVPEDRRLELVEAYREILVSVRESDPGRD